MYEDEEFDYDVAFNTIKHKPNFAKTEKEHNARETIGCYSRATLPNGEVVFEFMPMWEIDKVRSMSEGSGSKYSAWNTWRDEMIKKSVIKRHFKMLISGNPTEALATALKVENENNALNNNFTQTNQKATLMNAFQEETPQIENGNLFEDVEVKEEGKAIENSKASLDFQNTNPNEMTEEQIEMEMNKVAEESNLGLFEEPKDVKPKK